MTKKTKKTEMSWDQKIYYTMADFERAYGKYIRYRNDTNFKALSNAFGDFLECVEDMNRDFNRQLTFVELQKERAIRRTCDDYTIRYFTEIGRREALKEIRAKLSKI